jgi:hypothetical protein
MKAEGHPRVKRYALVFSDEQKPWTKTSGVALQPTFCTDDLEAKALALF